MNRTRARLMDWYYQAAACCLFLPAWPALYLFFRDERKTK